MGMATCITCGDTIRHNSGLRRNGQPMKHATAGWYHFPDSSKRDHLATPADGRSPEGEHIREGAQMDQAKARVKSSLQSGFDHLHARDTVNDIFRDRRAP